jgi:hypothetical protein
MGQFLSQAVPLTVAVGVVAFLWSRGVLDSWLARVGWSLVFGVLATLVMYALGTGTLHGTGDMWSHSSGGVVGLFVIGFRFLVLYFLIAGPWMVLGCLVAGTVLGVLLENLTK